MPSRTSKTSSSEQEGFGDKMKRMTGNGLQSTGLGFYKMKHQTKISLIETKINTRQKQFGVDYLTLVERKAPERELRRCLKEALADIADLREQIEESLDKIDDKESTVQQKMKPAPVETAPAKNTRKYGPPTAITVSGTSSSFDDGPNNRSSRDKRDNTATSTRSNGSRSPGNFRSSAATSNRSNRSKSPGNFRSPAATRNRSKSPGKFRSPAATSSRSRSPKSPAPAAKKNAISNGNRSPKKPSNGGSKMKRPDVPDEYKNADPSNWKCREYKFSGAATSMSKGKEETIKGSIAKGLQNFKANPGRYTAMAYQSDMTEWDEKDQQYLLLHRKGTERWTPQGISPKGWMTVHVNEFERLIPFKDDVLPKKYRDKYTDSMTFRGQKLVTSKNKAIMPGRGMGPGDTPGLKIIGDVDPSDIFQGSVGDCWLLSGISGVAEFDGAIKRLFRKTPNLDNMPMDKGSSATGNMYTVTLWDLKTWKEVDIVIDERLPAHYNGSGQLLAGKPSEDGELWACYLEKALAIHCGGWDKIEGGQCTHAWSLLTGCREQYQMKRNPETGNWRCFAKQNPKTKVWAEHANSPKDQAKTTWRVHWPEVGGGDHRDEEMDDNQMFQKLFAWDQENYIVAAGTHGTSDKQSTGGLIDNHAYTVIESVSNCAGTGIDLLKVRNPWGTGEIEDGEFDDDGPGWDKYPQIKKALNPVAADDGIFWVTKKEFFKFFKTIYLSASNMTEFIED